MRNITITTLILFLIISCKKETMPEPDNEFYSKWENYFDIIDYETPVNRYTISSMVKKDNNELIFSAFHRSSYYDPGNCGLYWIRNNTVEPIVIPDTPSISCTNFCQGKSSCYASINLDVVRRWLTL